MATEVEGIDGLHLICMVDTFGEHMFAPWETHLPCEQEKCIEPHMQCSPMVINRREYFHVCKYVPGEERKICITAALR